MGFIIFMKEEWRNIVGFDCKYKISNTGKVLSVARLQWNGFVWWQSKEIQLKPSPIATYLYVDLLNRGEKRVRFAIHRLVATHFIPNPDNLPQVNHKDGNKQNNNVENLEWCTSKYNLEHARRTGLSKNFGEGVHNAKLKEHDVVSIRELATKGISQYAIASRYNVTQTCISAIIRRKTWKHI